VTSRTAGAPHHSSGVIALNVALVLLYSPNFASALFPAIKLFQAAGFALLVVLLLVRRPRLRPLDLGLFAFLACVVASTVVNATRFDNAESTYIASSFLLKCLHVIALFVYCRSDAGMKTATRTLVAVLAIFAAHGLLQFIAVPTGWAGDYGTLDYGGYEYVNLGWLGIYRVGFAVDSAVFVRVQSFFQEPGFFAFYMLFGLMLCMHPAIALGRRARRAAVMLFATVTLMTLSLTGIVLLGVYATFKLRSRWFKMMIGLVVAAAVYFIVTNDNEFIGKAGSFESRLDDYAILQVMLRSWMSLAFGIGIGNDPLLGDMRINNFVFELYMYATPLGLLVMSAILIAALKRSARANHVLLMTIAYALSTPMAWSPLFYCAIYLTWMSPAPRRLRPAVRRRSWTAASPSALSLA
jgi:hypothetical protein